MYCQKLLFSEITLKKKPLFDNLSIQPHATRKDFNVTKTCSKDSIKESPEDRYSESSSGTSNAQHDQCLYCQEVFDTRSILNKHLATDHSDEGFHCLHCDTFFPVDKETFEVHVLSHSIKIESDYGLDVSSNSSPSDSDSSGEEYVPIKKPKKVFDRRTSRSRSREDPPLSPKKLFFCPVCSKTFKRSIDLKTHEKNEHPIKEEPAEGESEAGGEEEMKKFSEGEERSLSPSSDPELPFRCPCQRKFKSKRALHIHRASKRCPFRVVQEKKKMEEEVLPPRRRTTVVRAPVHDDDSSEESNEDSSDEDFAKKPKAGPSKDKEKPLYKCDTCGRQFKLKESYNTHVRIHTGEKPFTCHVCGKQFSHSGGLSYHLRHVHYGIKEHKCDICGRCFALKAALGDHRRIHTGERPYVCEVCGKDFKSKASLYIHSKIHTDFFPHPCKYCNRRFRWRQQLLGHLTTHTGEKKHYCATCGKGFGVKNDLTRHERIHSDLKPFPCTLCGVSFGQKRYLKNHIKSRHENRRPQNVVAPPPLGPPPPPPPPQPPHNLLPPAFPPPGLHPSVPLPHHAHLHHHPPPPHHLPHHLPPTHHHHHLHPHLSHHLPHLQ